MRKRNTHILSQAREIKQSTLFDFTVKKQYTITPKENTQKLESATYLKEIDLWGWVSVGEERESSEDGFPWVERESALEMGFHRKSRECLSRVCVGEEEWRGRSRETEIDRYGDDRVIRAQAEMRLRLVRARFSCKDSLEKMTVLEDARSHRGEDLEIGR